MTLTILFLHHNFPGQFTHLLHEFLKQDHKIYFISEACSMKPKPGINHILLGENDDTSSSINANFERTSKFRKAMINLRKQGVNPDIVVSHSGWGCSLHAKEVFSRTRVIEFVEWWYDPDDIDKIYREFPTAHLQDLDNKQRIAYTRMNVPIATQLCQADALVTATQWQKERFPNLIRNNIQVSHEGIDTNFYRLNQKWNQDENLILFASRGLEPIRGFPDLIDALPLILQMDKHAKVLIVGEDKCFYTKSVVYKKSAKSWALDQLTRRGADLNRIKIMSFTDSLTYARLLKTCSVFTYLSRSFIPSWGLFNAISSGSRVCSLQSQMQKSINKEYLVSTDMISDLQPSTIAEGILNSLRTKSILSDRIANRERIISKASICSGLSGYSNIIERVLS